MRLQAEFNQLRVFCIVIMLLRFHSRVREVLDFNRQTKFFACGLDHSRQVQNGKLFRELIEYPALPSSRRIQTCDLDAPNSVTNVEKAASLAPLAVYGERVSNSRLNAKTIKNCPEDVVIVEAVNKRFVQSDFVGRGSVHNALVE